MARMILLTVHLACFSVLVSGELIDLSYSYNEKTNFWPTTAPFRFIKEYAGDDKGFFYSSKEFATAEHCGTHLDAPYHFSRVGWKVDEIPIERLITSGSLLNVSSEVNGNCSYMLPADRLMEWEKEIGSIQNNSVLLVSFGWSSRYENKEDYFGPPENLCLPGLSKEAAEWIANTKKIVGVGVDSASVDQGRNVGAHIALNTNNIYMLENVALTQPLPTKFKIIVLPMKISNSSGAPCRVVAVVED